MMENNKNRDHENEMELIKETELELEDAREEEEELSLTTEEAEEILLEQAINPELQLSDEALAEMLRLMSEDPELVKMQQVYQMAQKSGQALANKDEIMNSIREMVQTVRAQFPGYEELDWMTIFNDIEESHELTTVLADQIQMGRAFGECWIRVGDSKNFRKAEPNENPESSGNDYLLLKGRRNRLYVWYYSNGEFFEEPTLLLQKKGAKEDDTFSILLEAGHRSALTGGMMPYRGECDEIEPGNYEIKFMTNYKTIDENGEIICE